MPTATTRAVSPNHPRAHFDIRETLQRVLSAVG
jgi:hypothetical protein